MSDTISITTVRTFVVAIFRIFLPKFCGDGVYGPISELDENLRLRADVLCVPALKKQKTEKWENPKYIEHKSFETISNHTTMSNISPRESKPIARRDSFIGRKVYPAQESVGTELTGRSEVSSEVNPTLDSHIDSPETVKSEKSQESKQHPEDKKEEHHRNGHHKDHDVLTYLNPNNIHNLHGLHPSGGGHDSDGDSSDNDPEIDHISVRKLPCIIMPSSPARIAWDMFILILLGFILVTTPLELAFEEVEENLETAVKTQTLPSKISSFLILIYSILYQRYRR